MEYTDVFPNLVLTEKEIEVFKDKLLTKGIYLHKQMYDVLQNESFSKDLTYTELSNHIRYDKYIRDILYKYLSAIEEFYRAVLFSKLEINDSFENPLVAKIKANQLVTKNDYISSKLFYISYSKYFDFGQLIDILNEKKLISNQYNDLKKVKELRNRVMHHNLILTSYYTDSDKVKVEIRNVEQSIELLYKLLPTKGLKEGLTKDINKGNYKGGNLLEKANMTRLTLGRFNNGVFE